MARTKISEFSATAADNTDIDNIDIAEGCAPSGINNAIRELMAQLKDMQTGASGDTFTFTTVDINGGTIDGTSVGATTASTGSFTTLSASSTVSGTGFSTYLASPPAIGGTTAAAGSFTTLTTSSTTTLNGGTANGVAYLNGSKALTTGSGFSYNPNTSQNTLYVEGVNSTGVFNAIGSSFPAIQFKVSGTYKNSVSNNSDNLNFDTNSSTAHYWTFGGVEQMRLTSTGLGIGTSSPIVKCQVDGTFGISSGGTYTGSLFTNSSALDLQAGSNATNGLRLSTSIATPIKFLTNGTEKMVLDSSGNLLVGTTTSGAFKVDVVGGSGISTSSAGNNPQVRAVDGTVISKLQALTAGYTGGYFGTESNHNIALITNNTPRLTITTGGEVYIAGTTDQGAYNLQCNGTGVWGAGAYVNGSDARIKKDVAPIRSGLNIVEKLNPVTYRYKEDWSKDQSVQTGFIAQELLTALDGEVYVDGVVQQGGEYMSVAYQNLIPVLTKAIQELKAEFDAYKLSHP